MISSTLKENLKNGTLRKPLWLKRRMVFQGKQHEIEQQIRISGLHTVCSEARCPNRSECYAKGTATFLVMGTVCTRNCTFCSVTKGIPGPLDKNEIHRIITAAKVMKLNHVVITSVTRDDLPDGGASFIAEIVHTFRKSLPKITIEILIPDLKGDLEALETVFAGRPDILNHNIETVPSLYRDIRPQANYNRSLLVLSAAKKSGLLTKSGLMVGLGEKTHEVLSVLDDLKRVGCSIVTIGQYLQPSSNQKQVKRYISPEEFQQYATYGENAGIKKVMAGPYVRSSYHAAEVMEEIA